MDPWLESRWAGIHHLLITMIQGQLNPPLRALGLVARIDERVYVESVEGRGRGVRPRVFVVRSPVSPWRATPPVTGGLATAAVVDEPIVLRVPDEPPTVGFVEILDAADQARVITAIEVLSPTNKIDPRARREYLRKHEEYRAADVSTVEIDLLRDGDPLIDVWPDLVPAELRTPYAVCVRRGWEAVRFEAEYYPVPLRSRLPRIRVPLRESDADARLDLGAALDAAYEQGSYDLTDYERPPEPPLNPADVAWARERIIAWRAAWDA